MASVLSQEEVAKCFAEADALLRPQAPSPPPVSVDPLTRFVEIQKRLKEIAAEEERLKKEAEPIQQRLLEEWADRGQKNANVAGMTVYIRPDFYCNKKAGVSQETVCAILQRTGFGDMVSPNYNAAKLKSTVKGLAEDDQVPEELKAVLSYDTVHRLVAVNG